MTKLDLKALDQDAFIRGDDVTPRTIIIGQQVTVSDIVVIDTAVFSVSSAGAMVLASTLSAAGITSTDTLSVTGETDLTGKVGINNLTHNEKLNVRVGSADGVECLELEQLDQSEGFVNFKGTSAADATKPISSLTAGNTIQGFIRIEINGTDRWIPFYDAPTS